MRSWGLQEKQKLEKGMKSQERGGMRSEQSAKTVKVHNKEAQHRRFVHKVKPRSNANRTVFGGGGSVGVRGCET